MKTMKKFLFVGAVTFLAMACAPLKIAMNKTDSEGVRTIVTSTQHLFGNYDIALGIRISDADTIMGVIIEAESNKMEGIFDQDDHLYLVLNDGSKITLRNVLDKDAVEVRKETKTSYDYGNPGWSYAYGPWGRSYFIRPYAATTYFAHTYETTVSNSQALYLITYDEIVRIITKGVKKLSIEADNDTEEMFNTGGLQDLFTSLFRCLGEGVKNPNDY